MRVVISDTTCLIHLGRLAHLDLLRLLYGKVWTTPTVAAEYGLALPEWFRIAAPRGPAPTFHLQLDPGEASALHLAQEVPDPLVLTDDLAARKVAAHLHIEVRGTLGILLAAKQQGHVAQLTPLIRQLRGEGMHVAEEIVRQVLRDAGE